MRVESDFTAVLHERIRLTPEAINNDSNNPPGAARHGPRDPHEGVTSWNKQSENNLQSADVYLYSAGVLFWFFVSVFFLKSWSWEVIGFGKLYFKMFPDKMKKNYI